MDQAVVQTKLMTLTLALNSTPLLMSGGIVTFGTTLTINDYEFHVADATGNSDTTEPYLWDTWQPSRPEVVAFADHVLGLSATDRSLTVTFNDNAPEATEPAQPVAPTANRRQSLQVSRRSGFTDP